MSKTNQQGIVFAFGLVSLTLLWLGLIYGLLGYIPADGQRWAATVTIAIILPGAVVLTRWLSMREAHAHVKGIDTGIEKVSRAASDTADIRTRMTTVIKAPPLSAAQRYDELLPKVPGAIIVQRHDDDTTPIEL